MGHCQAALLADRAVFRVTGIDARKFLQGMLTNDVGKLSDGEVAARGRYCLSRATPRCARMARAAAGGHERE